MFSTYIKWNRVICVCLYVLYTHSAQPHPYTRPNICIIETVMCDCMKAWMEQYISYLFLIETQGRQNSMAELWPRNCAIPRLKMWTAVRPGGRTELSSPLKPQVSEPWKSAVLTCDWAGIWPLLSAKRTGELQLARKQNKILENTIYLHKQNHSMHNEMQSTGMLMVNSAAHFRICLLVKLMSCVSLDMFDNSTAQNRA